MQVRQNKIEKLLGSVLVCQGQEASTAVTKNNSTLLGCKDEEQLIMININLDITATVDSTIKKILFRTKNKTVKALCIDRI